MNSVNSENANRKPSKEEIISAIKECAAKLGHVPREQELKRESGIGGKIFRRHFGNYTKALQASGFDGTGAGYKVSTEALFKEWAGMVRELGEAPSIAEYTQRTQYSVSPLRQRFGAWNNVPAALTRYAEANGLGEEWADVLEVAKRYRPRGYNGEWRSRPPTARSSVPQILKDRPVYGAAMLPQTMCFAPVNEMGVVYLFGALSSKLGFIVTWVGTQYPDIEAFREVEPGRWQRVRIEVEYQSRNFLYHFHDPKDCDLILCWENNWPEAPMEVIALKEHIEAMGGLHKA